MPKKGETNNPGGRPPKRPEDKVLTPTMQLGRVSEEDQKTLRDAAVRAGQSFTQWAVSILLRAAKRQR